MSEEVKVLAKELAKEIIKEHNKKTEKKRLHDTKLLMRYYTRLREHIDEITGKETSIEDIIDDLEEEDIRAAGDKIFIKSIIRTKLRTAKMLSYIEEALDIIQADMEAKGETYKYKAFELYFIDKKTNEQICEELNCGKNTPLRWSNEVIDQLSVLLWGIDALVI